jgi:4-diphosphocytidyl-2-C-methyl-D-erythritol kinase
MPTRVRSYSKINLGLAIGPPRADGFHSLVTLYQTLALHDLLTVSASRASQTSIVLHSNDQRVPLDARNTAWKMVERTLAALGMSAEVDIHIQKNLPIQGGMGAGSANAAAALLGLERELGLALDQPQRLALAAAVGSDVPLFLVGGSVLGSDRGQVVEPVADVTLAGATEIPCVIALPNLGVSTPQAFSAWDHRFIQPAAQAADSGLQSPAIRDTLCELGCTYASVLLLAELKSQVLSETQARSSQTDQPPDPGSVSASPNRLHTNRSSQQNTPEKLRELAREQPHTDPDLLATGSDESGQEDDPVGFAADNSLQALVRGGIENDFETVVFPQYPLLGKIKQVLLGEGHSAAIHASLSGSGSAVYGLYRTQNDAVAAQQRLQRTGVQAIATSTLPRPLYWSSMFAE